MSRPLMWSVLEWWLKRRIPASHLSSVLGDLLEDYRRDCSVVGRAAAEMKVVWGAASLANAYRDATLPDRERNHYGRAAAAAIAFGATRIRRQPLFAASVVALLGLGIGLATTMVTVVEAVLVKPLPYPAAQRLVTVWEAAPAKNLPRIPVSGADFVDFGAARSVTPQAAVYLDNDDFTLTGRGDPERIPGMAVSANLFSLLGVTPMLGRTFLPGEDTAGHAQEVVVSHKFWQQHLGADRSAVGSALVLDGRSYDIVGIMPAGFDFPPAVTFAGGGFLTGRDLWIPYVVNGANREYHPLLIIGRLAPDVTLEQARAELASLADRLAISYPVTNKGLSTAVLSMQDVVVQNARPALLTLMAGVGCLLLVACLNVASLLLTRVLASGPEMATRSALGAGRSRLIVDALAEHAMLVIPAGAIGGFLATWCLTLLRTLPNTGVPRLAELSIGWFVPAVAAGCSVIAAVLTGWVPALYSAPPDLQQNLREAGRLLGGRRQRRGQRIVVVGELTLALVLLIAAGLLFRSFIHLLHVDLGFEPGQVLTAQVSLPHSRYGNDVKVLAFEDQLLQQLNHLPGVESAATINSLPVVGYQAATLFLAEGRTLEPGLEARLLANERVVSPGYFRTMGIPLVRGRALSVRDSGGAPLVLVVSNDLARRFFPGQDPVGQRVRLDDEHEPLRTIVGVVGDVHQGGLADDAGAAFYLPYSQSARTGMSIVMRTTAPPGSFGETLRQSVWALDRQLPVVNVRPFDAILSGSLADRRFQLKVLAGFASLAFGLSLVGVYGVASGAVAYRTTEIALRMALGARTTTVVWHIVGQAVLMALAGIGMGSPVGLAIGGAMKALLFRLEPADPLTILGVSVMMLVTVIGASYWPASRAARIDPATTLRR